MAYFIFIKNSDGINGSLYKIAENKFDLDNLNIIQSNYKIIEVSQNNFDDVKYVIKQVLNYDGNTVNYLDIEYTGAVDKNSFLKEINGCKNAIIQFLNVNKGHPLYSKWNDYYNQLSNLNLNNINYPLNISLEQYLNNIGQTSLNILQLP